MGNSWNSTGGTTTPTFWRAPDYAPVDFNSLLLDPSLAGWSFLFARSVSNPDPTTGDIYVAGSGTNGAFTGGIVGPYVDTPFLELSVADFDHVMAANVRAAFLLTQAAGQRMKARGCGQVINIAATDAFHRSHSVYKSGHKKCGRHR